MKIKVSLIIAVLALTFGCNPGANQEEHGHEHGSDTHMHEGEEHGHENENGEHHHEQEEFTVGEDSTATEDHHEHEHEDGQDHQH